MEPLDDQNIFSEFEDEERRQLIEELIRQDPRLAELPRTNFFTLWFSDIEVLRVFANVLQRGDPNFKWRKYLLSTPDPSDVPGVFASSKQANKSSSKGKSSSGSRLPVPAQSPAGRTRSMSPRKGQPGLRERSINTPRTSWDDQQNPLGESSTAVQQSPSLGRDLTLVQPERQRRDDAMKKKCLERDSNRCIITKRDHPGIQCAHIIPYKLNGSSTRGATWEWLENFWGEARADRWKAELLGGSNHQINTEQVKNLITLASQEHNYWDNCLCAFRHLRTYEQNTKMDIAFHWLPLRGSEKRTDIIPTMSHPFPNQPQGYATSPGGNRYLLHCESLNLISSGHIFTVTTTNPVTHPLPSEELLKMQWNLSRIASMQGAGEDEDSDLDSDGDSVVVTSRSRSPTKEAYTFPEQSNLGSPAWSPSKGARMLSENVPFRMPTRSPSPSKARDLPGIDESATEHVD